MGRDTLNQQELFDNFKSIDTSKASVICIKCNEEKPIESFYTYVAKVQKTTGKPSSYRICKKCMQRLDKVRVELRKITPPPPKDYECPICLITADDYHLRTSTNNKWCLDHSHITGKARGWLCHKCNSAIGWLNDDSSNTRRATEYLERYEDDNS
tara:strand:- start:47 stop:511 length:465 start_codon:yes stop_codon:yes gene_type:complete